MARRIVPRARRFDTQYDAVPDTPPEVRYALGNFGGTGGSQLADKAPLTRLIYPPRIEKLLSSQDFRAQDWAVVLGAGAGTTASSAALSLQIPGTMVGWLQELSIYVLNQTAQTLVSFQVRINQGPVPGFENVQNSPGIANIFREDISDIRVRIPDGAVVDVVFTNQNANGPWTVGAKFAGWFHPWSDEERIFGHDY